MDLRIDQFLASSTTITMFTDVYSPSPSFSTTTVSRTEEELGPGWAMDDVYPPLAELRRALLTDGEWAGMSSWEKDVWEMFYRPDWERLACIEEILEGTPVLQRAHRHEEILEALRSLGASISNPASVARVNSCVDVCTCTSPHETKGCRAEVPAPASPSPDREDTFVPATGVATVEQLREGASEPIPVLAALQGASPSISIVKETVEAVPSVSSGFIAMAPSTCLLVCLSRHPVSAPVLVASSPMTSTEHILSTNKFHVAAVPRAIRGGFSAVLAHVIQLQQTYDDCELFRSGSSLQSMSKVPLHRPIPWPSFMSIHADGDESRPPCPAFKGIADCEDEAQPRSWPSFREIHRCEYPSDAVEKASWQCSSVGSSAITSGIVEFHILGLYGNRFNSTGCIIVHDMCWNEVLLLLEHWWSATECVKLAHAHYVGSCQLKGSAIQYSMRRATSSYDQFSCATRDASYWHGNFAHGSQTTLFLTTASRMSHWLASCVGAPVIRYPISVLSDEWLFSPCDLGEQANLEVSGSSKCYHKPMYTAPGSGDIDFRQCTVLSLARSPCYDKIDLAEPHRFGCHLQGAHADIVMSVMSAMVRNVGSSSLVILKGDCHRWNNTKGQWLYFSDVAIHVATYSNYPAEHQVGWGTNTTWCADSNSSCTTACWSAISIQTKELQSVDASAQLEWARSGTGSSVWAIEKLELSNCVSYMVVQYSRQRSIGIKTELHSFGDSINRAQMKADRGSLHRQYQEGINTLADSENLAYADHAWVSYSLVLLCGLDKELLPTWPPTIAYCSIAVWLLNHADMVQILIGWPPRAHACFIKIKLSPKDIGSRCFLCWFHEGSAMFTFLTFEREVVFQGGRCALMSNTCYLGLSRYIDSINSLDYNGLKVLHIPWDPGGSEFLPSSTTTAWGQAVFQGGRGVRVPPLHRHWLGLGWHQSGIMGLADLFIMGLAHLFVMGLSPISAINHRKYKYEMYGNAQTIQLDQERSKALASRLSASVPHLLL